MDSRLRNLTSTSRRSHTQELRSCTSSAYRSTERLLNLPESIESEIQGATSFFDGHGAQMGPAWHSFPGSLDEVFSQEPAKFPHACAGVAATFPWLEARMSPLTEAGMP